MTDPDHIDFNTLSTSDLYSLLATAESDDDRRIINRVIDARVAPVKDQPMPMRKKWKTPEDELGATYRLQTKSAMEDLHAKIRAERAASMK